MVNIDLINKMHFAYLYIYMFNNSTDDMRQPHIVWFIYVNFDFMIIMFSNLNYTHFINKKIFQLTMLKNTCINFDVLKL